MSTPTNPKPPVAKTGATAATGSTGATGSSATLANKLGFNQQKLIETVNVCVQFGGFFGLGY